MNLLQNIMKKERLTFVIYKYDMQANCKMLSFWMFKELEIIIGRIYLDAKKIIEVIKKIWSDLVFAILL